MSSLPPPGMAMSSPPPPAERSTPPPWSMCGLQPATAHAQSAHAAIHPFIFPMCLDCTNENKTPSTRAMTLSKMYGEVRALRDRLRLGAEAVDAGDARRGAAAVGRRRALLEFLRAARLLVGADEPAAARPLAAEAAAALVAGLAAGAVGVAGIDGPEAARVAGVELLRRQVEGGMRRIGAGRRVEVDRGDPQLLRRDDVLPVVEARIGVIGARRRHVAVEAAAGEHDPRVAAGDDRVHRRLVVQLLVGAAGVRAVRRQIAGAVELVERVRRLRGEVDPEELALARLPREAELAVARDQ